MTSSTAELKLKTLPFFYYYIVDFKLCILILYISSKKCSKNHQGVWGEH